MCVLCICAYIPLYPWVVPCHEIKELAFGTMQYFRKTFKTKMHGSLVILNAKSTAKDIYVICVMEIPGSADRHSVAYICNGWPIFAQRKVHFVTNGFFKHFCHFTSVWHWNRASISCWASYLETTWSLGAPRLCLKHPNCFETWQVAGLHCCWVIGQFESHSINYQSRVFL